MLKRLTDKSQFHRFVVMTHAPIDGFLEVSGQGGVGVRVRVKVRVRVGIGFAVRLKVKGSVRICWVDT